MKKAAYSQLPYFDTILEAFNDNSEARMAFKENVHWGYWDQPKKGFVSSEQFHEAGMQMAREVVACAHLSDGQGILDVGCGFGGLIRLIDGVCQNCKLVGINIDERQLAIARQRSIASGNNSIDFINADASMIPLPDASFDRIICMESIFHFQSRMRFIAEASRMLKPGGMLVVSDFVPVGIAGLFFNLIEKTTGLVRKAYGTLHLNISLPRYRHIGVQNNLVITENRDITRHTFPTYRFLKDHFNLIDHKRSFMIATTLIEYASRIGLLRYRIITFKKT